MIITLDKRLGYISTFKKMEQNKVTNVVHILAPHLLLKSGAKQKLKFGSTSTFTPLDI